ncbi:hypothetical protein AB205_0121190, partial [Aquarana catesbeiana]
MRHAKQIFPMLDCMDDLRKISDLRLPPNWYPDARAIQRKIIFHSGPTNSGKTYHAIQRYLGAKSGIYCGPLKLLAHEIYKKSNDAGVSCDLITGEELIHVDPEGRPGSHASCTIEMCSVNTPYEVAVIDEIQMIRDPGRGWAWTRALLGLCAQEIHICGEAAAIKLVTELMYTTGEEVEVRNYDRLTPIKILDHSLGSLDNLRPGDCIVCFNKNDIYSVSRQIEARGLECAVIYGSLPPGTKLAQANKFNDPNDSCKILVATDAIGMGLNLSIKRIIFNSLVKPTMNEKGGKEMDTISTSQALQIGGRAGRFSSMYKDGEITTMLQSDLTLLKEILSKPVSDIQAAGLHPTAEQIEMFAYHLPDATLSNLIDIFVSLSQVDGRYFVCNIEDFKFVADMIQHIPLNLRARYVFCTAPINRNLPFVCTSLLKGQGLTKLPELHAFSVCGGDCCGLSWGPGLVLKAYGVCAPGVAVQGCQIITVSGSHFDLRHHGHCTIEHAFLAPASWAGPFGWDQRNFLAGGPGHCYTQWPPFSLSSSLSLTHFLLFILIETYVCHVLSLYTFVSMCDDYRFMDMFPHAGLVRSIQKELDAIIQNGVYNITKLIRASEAASSLHVMEGTVLPREAPTDENSRTVQKGNRGSRRTPINSEVQSGSLTSKLFARQFSRNEPLTFQWICKHVHWPVSSPKSIKDLMHLESVHDILDLYLWLR